MRNEDNGIIKYNHGETSMKVPFIIYADVESLLEKMSNCHYNPEKSSTTKIDKHTPSGYSLFTHCSFDLTKNKLDCCRGKDCVKRYCKDLKEHAAKTINYDKKGMIPLTDEENISLIKSKKYVTFAKKDLVLIIKSIINSEIIVTTQENIGKLPIVFVI